MRGGYGEPMDGYGDNDAEDLLEVDMIPYKNDRRRRHHLGWLSAIYEETGLHEFARTIRDEKQRRLAESYRPRYPWLDSMVKSMAFEAVFGILIIINCVYIGLAANNNNSGGSPSTTQSDYSTAEHFFTAVFFIEWILRVTAGGWVWMFDLANFADFLLVFVTGVMANWFLEPLGADVSLLRKLTVLRALRLVRLARAVRLLPVFKEMWLLLKGLLDSVLLMLWTLIIVTVLLFMFAVWGVEIIGRNPEVAADPLTSSLFPTLHEGMFTLFQVLTLDTWADTVARPLMVHLPRIGLYFVAFITVVVFVLMNLVTAVVVENAFAIAQTDEEQQARVKQAQKRKDILDLKDLFMELDTDGSGELDIKEFNEALGNQKIADKIASLGVEREDMQDIWDLMDNGDGHLTIEEFTGGLRKLKGGARPKEVLVLLKGLRQALVNTNSLSDQVWDLCESIGDTVDDLDDVRHDIGVAVSAIAALKGHFKDTQGIRRKQTTKSPGQDGPSNIEAFPPINSLAASSSSSSPLRSSIRPRASSHAAANTPPLHLPGLIESHTSPSLPRRMFAEGITWIYDANLDTWPIAECPGFIINTRDSYVDGPRCSTSIAYADSLARYMKSIGLVPSDGRPDEYKGKCIIPDDFEDDIVCYNRRPCDATCTTFPVPGRCPDPDTLPYMETVSIYKQITPSNMTAIRGLILGACLILVVWLIGELILRNVDIKLRKQHAEGMARQAIILPPKRRELRAMLEEGWALEASIAGSDQASTRAGSDTPMTRYSSSVYGMYYPEAYQSPQIIAPLSTVNQQQQQYITPPPTVDRALGESYRYSTPSTRIGYSPRSIYCFILQLGVGFIQVTLFQLVLPPAPMEQGIHPLLSVGYRHQHQGCLRAKWSQETQERGKEAIAWCYYATEVLFRFESCAWRRRLRQWKELQNQKRWSFSSRQLMRTVLLNTFYVAILVCTMYLIIYMSPQNSAGGADALEVLEGNVSIWEIHTWLDFIIFIDVLLDTGLFLAAAITVKWPRAPVFSRHLQGALESVARQGVEDGQNGEHGVGDDWSESSSSSGSRLYSDDSASSGSSTDTRSLSFVLKQSLTHDCCLMIACHESTMTKERYELFSGTLRAALMVFPPSHIFVCDNGNSPAPVDDTQMATREAHPDINYIYVPEGNKTFAFYWCNKFWIPFLARHSKVADFKYAVIIDDDVPLPADLHIPHEHLRNHPEIKAVHFPITAVSSHGTGNMLVKCQDIEYKLAAVHKLFQSSLSRCLSCHGAIALWERRALEAILYEHDTVFHGEDMYMGLCLLHRRDDSRIISCAQSVVPTYAPDSFPMLFRQRVKSWELTSHRKTFTYIKEVLSPASFCHAASLILKPYFLQEVLTILLDWLRTFLLTGLLLRDWVGLLLMTSVFTCLLYIQIIIFQLVVLRQRKELRSSLLTIILFPWYRLMGLMFRLCALCQNLLVYSHDRTFLKIGQREDEIRDIPPCPPHPDVDWFSIWIEDDLISSTALSEKKSNRRRSKHRETRGLGDSVGSVRMYNNSANPIGARQQLYFD
ncbi:hypothetical protein FOL47_008260 [Perkinsus chesapeaki]|uniref:EF-hand domain-containing protein n=1 Tax=Perkinsus chesapeaki TaxID=330153 RepID=A0A7J6MU08_PERCH|nr:hypothetical protein FOL47_008260 [Perkinsus chesapeaki]